MLVATVKNLDVEVAFAMLRERMPEMLGQFDREGPDSVARVPDFVNQVRPSRKVDDGARQRLVHRRVSRAVTRDPLFIAQSLGERLSNTDRRIFDRMVVVNLQIAFTLDFEIEQPMAREQVEHMVEKRDA